MTAPETQSPEPGPLLDATLKRALAWVAIAGGCLMLAGGGFFGGKTALSVVAGAVTAIVNLLAFAFIARALLGSKASGGYTVLALLKMGALLGGLFWLFRSGFVSVLPFVVGFGSLPIGISIAQTFAPKLGARATAHGVHGRVCSAMVDTRGNRRYRGRAHWAFPGPCPT